MRLTDEKTKFKIIVIASTKYAAALITLLETNDNVEITFYFHRYLGRKVFLTSLIFLAFYATFPS